VTPLRTKDWRSYLLIRRTFFHLNCVFLIIVPLFLAGKIKLNRLVLRKCRRGQLQAQDGKLREEQMKAKNESMIERATLGPLFSPAARAELSPRLAFQRAKLSSPASNFSYSSTLFPAAGL
jgi:hypothetical protein